MEINEIIEKQVKTWQEKDNEKRSVIVIATEDLADNKTALAMGIMGKAFNLKLAIAKALNADERLHKLLDDGVKLALVERILSGNTKKEEETK
jgi:hypothetical protein|nr:MAG TPA: hypothetical protein [Caudoviricetes sp.]